MRDAPPVELTLRCREIHGWGPSCADAARWPSAATLRRSPVSGCHSPGPQRLEVTEKRCNSAKTGRGAGREHGKPATQIPRKSGNAGTPEHRKTETQEDRKPGTPEDRNHRTPLTVERQIRRNSAKPARTGTRERLSTGAHWNAERLQRPGRGRAHQGCGSRAGAAELKTYSLPHTWLAPPRRRPARAAAGAHGGNTEAPVIRKRCNGETAPPRRMRKHCNTATAT